MMKRGRLGEYSSSSRAEVRTVTTFSAWMEERVRGGAGPRRQHRASAAAERRGNDPNRDETIRCNSWHGALGERESACLNQGVHAHEVANRQAPPLT
eukprot:ctg_1236.g390